MKSYSDGRNQFMSLCIIGRRKKERKKERKKGRNKQRKKKEKKKKKKKEKRKKEKKKKKEGKKEEKRRRYFKRVKISLNQDFKIPPSTPSPLHLSPEMNTTGPIPTDRDSSAHSYPRETA